MPLRPKKRCQARILDAAETAFADGGYNGASMRDIVREAGVNLATVYYYFRSKSGLMEAVLKRRFGPLRQEHLEILRRFEREAMGRPVPVGKILEAMLLPPLQLMASPAAKRLAVTRLIGRIVAEPDAQTQKILRSQRSEVRAAFLKALQASLPHTSPADLQWRMEFVWGALAFILCNPRSIEVETHGACNPVDAKEVLTEMIGFFSAGFRATAKRRNRCSILAAT
ncbi:putative Transcriptional regulator, TetR family [Verrucomicrobia bacterium]|nr:putative Transcriptional regulator, TetR family [Verrucomicrobiota bacterium]